MAIRIIVGFLLAILLCAARLPAQTGALNGYCTLGAAKASTSGLPSINYLEGVIPDCTVTVYLTGTTTKATLYSDQHNTPLTNPFTAVVTSGKWLFYASTANAYDIVMSGGIPPNVYTVPVTLTSVGIPSPNSTINPIGPPYNCKIDGVTNDTACWQAVCAAAQLIDGLVLMPAGTSLVTQQICTITQPMGFLGAGQGQSTLSFTGSTAIPAAFEIYNTSNVEIGGMTITGTSSTTTGMLTGIKVRYSKHINLHDLTFSSVGYASGANPHANIYTENDYDVKETNIRLTGTGADYALVNGYFGATTVGLHQTGIIDENNLATNELTNFNCQFCDVQHSSVNQNNQPLGTLSNGYAYLYYATNTTFPLTCTGSGTLTCTVALSGGVTQIPVAPYFRAMIYGVTGGTGTLNSTFDGVLASSTTFTVTGAGNTAGASYAGALLFFPTTNNLLSDIHGKNTAGTCIYLQGSLFSTVTNWDCEDVVKVQISGSLPAGCVAVAGGNPNGLITQGVVIGPGQCNGSGQNGIEFADSSDLVITGVTINNAAGAGIRSFPGSFGNANFNISSTIIDNSPSCFKTAISGTNTGSVSMDCSNYSVAGIIPQLPGIKFHDSNLTSATYLPGVDDFVGGNSYDNITCTGCYFILAGTSPMSVTNSAAKNVIAGAGNAGIKISGAQHLSVANFRIDGASAGIIFSNNGATQPSDITLRNTHIANMNGQTLITDSNAQAITITTNTSTAITITTAVPVSVGMGIGDFGTGGNNDIPAGTTITAVTPPCNAGCAATISHAATGSHAGEAGRLIPAVATGVRIWDTDAQCTPATNTQGFLFTGMQNLDLQRNSISGCVGEGDIDLRGITGQIGPVTISGGTVTQSSGVASVYLPGTILGSAANVTVQGLFSGGTGTNDFFDHGTGTGNVFDIQQGSTTQTPAANVTNPNTTLRGRFTVALTPGAVAASACAEQTFALSGGNGQIVQAGQTITVTPPGAMTHVSIGYARGAASDQLVIQFCGDSTGGTPPAGTYTVSVL